MIGKLYYKLFTSDFGEKYLDTKVRDGKMDWTEKGMRRLLFWNNLIFFLGIFTVIGFFLGYSIRMVLSGIIISLYITEKIAPYMNAMMMDFDKVNYEPKPPIRDRPKYQYFKRALNGEKII